jgi:hypothetical protein
VLAHPSSPLPGTRRQRHVLFGRVSSLPPFTGSTFAGRPGARFDALPRTQGGFSSARPCPRRPILPWWNAVEVGIELTYYGTSSPHPTALRCKSTHQQIRVGTQICRSCPAWRAPLRAPRFRVVAPLARERLAFRPVSVCAAGVAAPLHGPCWWLLPARGDTRAFLPGVANALASSRASGILICLRTKTDLYTGCNTLIRNALAFVCAPTGEMTLWDSYHLGCLF